MIRGLYTSASGMFAGQRRMDVTAHNIANVQTAGYKRQTAHFTPYLDTALVRQDGSVRGIGGSHHGVRLDELRRETSEGPPEYTGQDYAEGSNVKLASEMVELIVAARTYAANQRLVSTHDSLLEKAVNQVGLVR